MLLKNVEKQVQEKKTVPRRFLQIYQRSL